MAASPHFKEGRRSPCARLSGTTSIPVTCTGTLAGLGNEDLNIHLSVSGFALYQCQNNWREHRARPEQGAGRASYFGHVHSGRRDQEREPDVHHESRHLDRSTNVSGAVAGLSEPQLDGGEPTLTLANITLDIFQPVTTQIFHCTASNPNGLTSPVTLTCT